MERSLTLLLPVRNAESTLAREVSELLEIMPELTRRFELMIIDDGSVDGTSEVADELRQRFPQVRLCTHSRPLGDAAAINTGLKQCSGEVVLARNDRVDLGHRELRALWLRAASDTQSPRDLVADARKSVRWVAHRPSVAGHAARPGSLLGRDRPSAAQRPRRPNYLARLRDFAFGE